MVIYNSADSDNLIQALSTNIKTAKAVFDKVKQGTQHLSSVIDSGTLSGSAYRAGQSLFQTYIIPMIQKLDSAIDDIQSDLDNYKKAEQHVRSLDSHLDENYLKGMLNNTNQMIRLIEQKIQEDKKVMEKLANLHFDELVKGLQEIPGLEQQLDNMKQLKYDYEKKIQALQTFASSTNSLFTDSLQAFKYALQGVDIINQSKASVDGTITFPAGADMSWSSKLQNEKFSSNLIKETKTKADKISASDIEEQEIANMNAETKAQLEQIALATGLTLAQVIAMYAKASKAMAVKGGEIIHNVWDFISGEFNKIKHDNHISDTDIIKTITTSYVDPSSGVQHGVTFVINETTGEIISQKSWGLNGEIQNIIFKFGGPQIKKTSEKYAIKSPSIQKLQKYQSNSKGQGMGLIELGKIIDRAKSINASLSMSEVNSTGKEYQESLKKAEEEMRRKKEQQERERHIKEMQNISNGGPGYFAH